MTLPDPDLVRGIVSWVSGPASGVLCFVFIPNEKDRGQSQSPLVHVKEELRCIPSAKSDDKSNIGAFSH